MKTILIVEDDPVTLRVYRSHLERAGFKVESANDGATGIAFAQVINPDGVLLDLMMPKLNGFEFLKRFREMKEFKHVPVIAFTNAYVAKMTEDARQAGATQVVDKSTITPQALVSCFKYEMERKKTSEPAAPTGTPQQPPPAPAQ